ncbi:hypothetical protein D9757_014408 [Collybiopsis confluens]|uniref:Uncharacterized protein n=1 Tax=Collybiopsis confluens TaxID=2823264 RepID=A0A8H5CLZ4_9AGAR|nr:hypothetical protein D9757_014408 [Collybiopsis confluens]
MHPSLYNVLEKAQLRVKELKDLRENLDPADQPKLVDEINKISTILADMAKRKYAKVLQRRFVYDTEYYSQPDARRIEIVLPETKRENPGFTSPRLILLNYLYLPSLGFKVVPQLTYNEEVNVTDEYSTHVDVGDPSCDK